MSRKQSHESSKQNTITKVRSKFGNIQGKKMLKNRCNCPMTSELRNAIGVFEFLLKPVRIIIPSDIFVRKKVKPTFKQMYKAFKYSQKKSFDKAPIFTLSLRNSPIKRIKENPFLYMNTTLELIQSIYQFKDVGIQIIKDYRNYDVRINLEEVYRTTKDAIIFNRHTQVKLLYKTYNKRT